MKVASSIFFIDKLAKLWYQVDDIWGLLVKIGVRFLKMANFEVETIKKKDRLPWYLDTKHGPKGRTPRRWWSGSQCLLGPGDFFILIVLSRFMTWIGNEWFFIVFELNMQVRPSHSSIVFFFFPKRLLSPSSLPHFASLMLYIWRVRGDEAYFIFYLGKRI